MTTPPSRSKSEKQEGSNDKTLPQDKPAEEMKSWLQEFFQNQTPFPEEEQKTPPSTAPISTNFSQEKTIPEGLILDGRYRLLDLLGKGGMGTVYKAEHILMRKPVAIKLITQEGMHTKEVVQRFTREAQLASQLQDAHCVTIHDFGQTYNQSLYLVMEYLEGEGLRERLKRLGRLSLERAHDVISQILEALEAAHEKGIIHRDIKPENIMLVEQGDRKDFVKILDFGIARATKTQESKLTQASLAVGTPGYMAPEQAVGKGAPEARSDLYSAAVIFYEMLCGKRPFATKFEMAEVTNQLVQPPPSPREVLPQLEIPAALEAVLLRALSRNVKDRFATAKEMRQAITRSIGRKPRPLRSITASNIETFHTSPSHRSGLFSRAGVFLDKKLAPLFTRGFWVEFRHGGWRDISSLLSIAVGLLLLGLLIFFSVILLQTFLPPKTQKQKPLPVHEKTYVQSLPEPLAEIAELYQQGEFTRTLRAISALSSQERQSGAAQRILALTAAELGHWEEVRPAYRAAWVLSAIDKEDRATLLRQAISELASNASQSARQFLSLELRAIEGLSAATKDSDLKRRRAAVEGLLEIEPQGKDLIPFYLDALKAAQDCQERIPLVKALLASKDSRVYPLLQIELERGTGVFEENACLASMLAEGLPSKKINTKNTKKTSP